MSVQDEAERLRGLASSRAIPIEILHQAEQELDNLQAEVRSILGDVSQHLPALEAAVAEVKAGLQQAIGAAKGFEEMLHNAADGHARG